MQNLSEVSIGVHWERNRVATVGEKELCIYTLDDLAENTRSHIGERIWIEAEWDKHTIQRNAEKLDTAIMSVMDSFEV